jgi:hypothetical protein
LKLLVVAMFVALSCTICVIVAAKAHVSQNAHTALNQRLQLHLLRQLQLKGKLLKQNKTVEDVKIKPSPALGFLVYKYSYIKISCGFLATTNPAT